MLLVLLLASSAALCVAGYLLAVHRARDGADLAALAGATAAESGGDGCAAAARNADSNRVRLVECQHHGDTTDFVVSVRVVVAVHVRLSGLPTTVGARADAGPVPP